MIQCIFFILRYLKLSISNVYEYRYYLPTRSNSLADGFVDRKRDQISIVNMVDAELKIDVNEEIRAANITASIMPRKPIQLY